MSKYTPGGEFGEYGGNSRRIFDSRWKLGAGVNQDLAGLAKVILENNYFEFNRVFISREWAWQSEQLERLKRPHCCPLISRYKYK